MLSAMSESKSDIIKDKDGEGGSNNGGEVVQTKSETSGCTDPLAVNYDSSATKDDDSCVPRKVGCMDEKAENYDRSYNVNDRTMCRYAREEEGCIKWGATMNFDGPKPPGVVAWQNANDVEWEDAPESMKPTKHNEYMCGHVHEGCMILSLIHL